MIFSPDQTHPQVENPKQKPNQNQMAANQNASEASFENAPQPQVKLSRCRSFHSKLKFCKSITANCELITTNCKMIKANCKSITEN